MKSEDSAGRSFRVRVSSLSRVRRFACNVNGVIMHCRRSTLSIKLATRRISRNGSSCDGQELVELGQRSRTGFEYCRFFGERGCFGEIELDFEEAKSLTE